MEVLKEFFKNYFHHIKLQICQKYIRPGGVSITKAHQAVPDLKNIVPKVPE